MPSMSDLDGTCLAVFRETYGQDLPTDWLTAWRAEFARLSCQEVEARALARQLSQSKTARDKILTWLRRQDFIASASKGNLPVAELPGFFSLSPMARELARVAADPQIELTQRLISTIKKADRALLNVSKEFNFVVWSFECTFTGGPGFHYLDDKGELLPHANLEQLGLPTSKEAMPPLTLETVRPLLLAARSLAAVAYLLFPATHSTRENFADFKDRIEDILDRAGFNAVSLAAIDVRGARLNERMDAWQDAGHPATRYGIKMRRDLRHQAVLGTQGGPGRGYNLPVWLPWPDGFRDARRTQALELRSVRV